MNKLLYLTSSILAVAFASVCPAQTPEEGAVTRTHLDPALQWRPCPDFMPEGCAMAILHGDPARENADLFFKVPAGASIPRHWHTSPERMVLVSGDLQVSYDGQDAVHMRPGTYAYGPARLPHQAQCRGEEPCVLAIAFVQPVDAHPGAPEMSNAGE